MSLSSVNVDKMHRNINKVFFPGATALGISPSDMTRKAKEKYPEYADPLNLTDAQQLKLDREEEKRYQGVVTKAGRLQKDINKRYGLQGNLTILGG